MSCIFCDFFFLSISIFFLSLEMMNTVALLPPANYFPSLSPSLMCVCVSSFFPFSFFSVVACCQMKYFTGLCTFMWINQKEKKSRQHFGKCFGRNILCVCTHLRVYARYAFALSVQSFKSHPIVHWIRWFCLAGARFYFHFIRECNFLSLVLSFF